MKPSPGYVSNMPSVFVCCLALLHALSLAVTSLALRRDEMVGVAPAYQSASAHWTEATDRSSDEALRSPERAAVAISMRALHQLPIGRGSDIGSPVPPVNLRSAQISTERDRFGRGMETHRVASRGAVLPYFPTAPPLRA